MSYVFQVSLTICNFLFVCFVFVCLLFFWGGFFVFFFCLFHLLEYKLLHKMLIKRLQCSLIDFFLSHYFFSFSSRYYVPVFKDKYFEIQYLVYFVNTGTLHLFLAFRKKIFVLFFGNVILLIYLLMKYLFEYLNFCSYLLNSA